MGKDVTFFTKKRGKKGEGSATVLKAVLLPIDIVDELKLYRDVYGFLQSRTMDSEWHPHLGKGVLRAYPAPLDGQRGPLRFRSSRNGEQPPPRETEPSDGKRCRPSQAEDVMFYGGK